MSLGNIVKKEVKELITPGIIISMLVMALIFVMMGQMIGGIEEGIRQKPVIGLIVNDNGELSDVAEKILYDNATIVYNGTDVDEGLDVIEEEGGLALLIIHSNFTSNIYNNKSGEIEIHWIMRGVGLADAISPTAVEWLIYLVNNSISEYIIDHNTTINSSVTLNPISRNETTIVKGIETKNLSPSQIGGMISAQTLMTPIIMMMVILMTGGMVLSSMGMEKENKTLETLLTLPISRGSIVAGKIIGSAVVGLVMAGIYMSGFVYYMNAIQGRSNINLEDYGLALGPFDYILVGISVFMAIMAGLALCMLLGTFVKNFKSAQTLTFPVTALAMIPMFITMFMDFDTSPMSIQVILFIIPFSHPMMAQRALIFDNYLLVLAGIVYSAIFAFITISIAVWIFKSDKLLVGRIKTDEKKKFGKLFR